MSRRIIVTMMMFLLVVCIGCGQATSTGSSEHSQDVTEAEPTETPEPTPTPEPTATPMPASIIRVEGDVNPDLLARSEVMFADVIKSMRNEGVLGENEAGVFIDGSCVRTSGLSLEKSGDVYVFTIAWDSFWIPGMAKTINGVNLSSYNADLAVSLLGLISDAAGQIFSRIDTACFGEPGISSEEWETIGDCHVMGDGFEFGSFISFKIRPMRYKY